MEEWSSGWGLECRQHIQETQVVNGHKGLEVRRKTDVLAEGAFEEQLLLALTIGRPPLHTQVAFARVSAHAHMHVGFTRVCMCEQKEQEEKQVTTWFPTNTFVVFGCTHIYLH